MASEILLKELNAAAEEHFGFLKTHGFHFMTDTAVANPMVVSLDLVANHVALSFSIDVRDAAISCYVAKAVNGRAALWGSGYNFNSLPSYLRERKVPYKDAIPAALRVRKATLAEEIQRVMHNYSIMLRVGAPNVINDIDDFSS